MQKWPVIKQAGCPVDIQLSTSGGQLRCPVDIEATFFYHVLQSINILTFIFLCQL